MMKKRVGLLIAAIAATVAGCHSTDHDSGASSEPQARETRTETTTRTSSWPTRRGGDYAWSSVAYPTGNARTSAVGLEKGLPREVRLNNEFDYELIVTNLTDTTLEDVVVTDDPGENLKIVSASGAQVGSGGGLTWAVGELGPRESKTLRVKASAGAEGIVGTCAGVSYNSTLCATVPVVAPKLRLTKTGPAEVLKCDEIEYIVEVANTGSGSVRDVKITDDLPDGVQTTDGRSSVTIPVPELAAGETKKYRIRAQATKTGRFTNSASATAAGGLSANSGQVTTVVKAPKLEIEKTCPETQFINRPLNYTITVSNTGNGVARNTSLVDSLPNGAEFASASDGGVSSGNQVRWNLGDLAPGASKQVQLRLIPRGAGTYRQSARATADCAEAVTAACESVVTGIPAILLEVVDLDDPVEVGNNETYVITVTNQGSAPDTNIKITCLLEANQEYVSSGGATNGTARGNTITFAPIASLAPKAQAEFRVVVKNVQAGDVRFKVQMTSDELTRPVEETEATNVYE